MIPTKFNKLQFQNNTNFNPKDIIIYSSMIDYIIKYRLLIDIDFTILIDKHLLIWISEILNRELKILMENR